MVTQVSTLKSLTIMEIKIGVRITHQGTLWSLVSQQLLKKEKKNHIITGSTHKPSTGGQQTPVASPRTRGFCQTSRPHRHDQPPTHRFVRWSLLTAMCGLQEEAGTAGWHNAPRFPVTHTPPSRADPPLSWSLAGSTGGCGVRGTQCSPSRPTAPDSPAGRYPQRVSERD